MAKAELRAMQVEVHGHADSEEAAVGNASVSEARAEAAAAFLRQDGAPADVIEITAFGARRPMVPASGAEPQNRRAEFDAR